MKQLSSLFIMAIGLIVLLATTAQATEKNTKISNLPTVSADKPATAHEAQSDSMDIKKIEEKYWTAKDDEYGVIQNRTFSKQRKYYVSLVHGPLINDPFASARVTGLMGGYYFSEDFGVEFSYFSYASSQNDTVSAYENQFGGAKPDYNLIKGSKTLSLVYSPFYAKMSFMNKSIMYFDMGFTAGLGLSDYEIQKVDKDGGGNKTSTPEMKSSPHLEIGLMQQLFVNKNVAIRLDIKNSIYKQDTKQYEIGIGAPESSRQSGSKSSNDTTITMGLTFFTN